MIEFVDERWTHSVFNASDALRVQDALRKLARHATGTWTLTGGFAIEINCLVHGKKPLRRRLNDLDFLVESFDDIPPTIADDFLFRHIHPLDPPGKTLLQLVDTEIALRIDVFRAYGATMSRAMTIGNSRVISLADLAARMARLSMDVAAGSAVPAGYATDFLRLSELADAAQAEEAWRDHRKPSHPASFADAAALLRDLIPHRPDLLTARDYSRDYLETCTRCAETNRFHLAPPQRIFDVLGYV